MITAAEKFAARLRLDAAERDQAGEPPDHEVGALRETGLLALDPDDHVTTHAATRIVAAADPSIGHLLGYHHLHLWRAAMFENIDLVAHLRAGAAEQGWFVAGVSNPGDALQLAPVGDGFRLDGTRTFATGASVADQLMVHATRADTGERLVVVLPAHAPGITHPADWDNMGQRLSASGSIVCEDVRVDAGDVLGSVPAEDDPRMLRLSVSAIAFQAVLAQLLVGIADGALAEAADYTRNRTRPWPASGLDTATDDPYILAGYGELVAAVRAAGLLADHATAALQHVTDQGAALTAEQRGAAAVTISSAKVMATAVVDQTTSRIFEFIGARATATRYGFDRFWRNARTLTLHDPVAYKARELGAHYLTGALPPFTAYS
jgi:alkylation response protein AidB-like acyl-CoA dehydrogenase